MGTTFPVYPATMGLCEPDGCGSETEEDNEAFFCMGMTQDYRTAYEKAA